MNTMMIAVAGTCFLASRGFAEPTAEYFFKVQDRFLAPGESTAVSVWVTISPTIGAPWYGGGPGSVVVGLSDGGFSIIGRAASATGSRGAGGSWSQTWLDAPYSFPLGTSVGTNAGMNVDGVIWGLGFVCFGGHPSPNDPDAVWNGVFTADAASPAGSISLDVFDPLLTAVQGGAPITSVVLYQTLAGRGTTIHIGACYADCDRSGWLGVADFACFQQAFAMSDAYAECDGDGMLTLADVICFQQQFTTGCP